MRRNKKGIWFLILGAIVALAAALFFMPMFEKNPPKIEALTNGYTNLKNPIVVKISDDRGLKSYEVYLIRNNQKELLIKGENLPKEVTLKIKLPRVKAKEIDLEIVATDTSKWHFFSGNKTIKNIHLIVDKIAPDAQVVNNSYAIGRGGSALAIVKVKDNNLENAYILVNDKYKFKLTPFVKENYYIALIAWPVNEKSFEAKLIATDLAGNKVKEHIPYFWRTKGIYKPKNVKIKISDKFINQVAIRVLEKMQMDVPDDPVEIFKMVNEKIRKLNEKEIFNITRNVYEDKISSFFIRRFNPLPGSAKRADFGEIRHYLYKGREISKAIHKGVDLAKVRRAKIYSSNNGIVVASHYIGIYGNTLIIYHGLGLYSLYGHTSEFLVKKGDRVTKGDVIARTGATGAVFGDHLHFGIYVQGYPVQPLEWMDSHWIKSNILNVINEAKRMIK
jgi:murein DD-endopeptidase MepM/ murein hydrolase activator NlpD